MKNIRFTRHASKRVIEYVLDENKISQVIKNTEAYDDLSQLGNNRIIHIGRIGREYWTIPCALTKDTIDVITIRKAYMDEIKISKKGRK